MKIRKSNDQLKFTMGNHMHRKTAYTCIETGPRLLWFNIIADHEFCCKPEDLLYIYMYFFYSFFFEGKILNSYDSSQSTKCAKQIHSVFWLIKVADRLLSIRQKKEKRNRMNSFSIAFQLYNNNDDIVFNGQVILLPVLTKWSLQNLALGTAAVLSWRANPCCDQMAHNYITAR